MRIVIDFQGAQTGSRYRGIGRYTTALVQAMIRRAPEHEFILVLNGQFQSSIESIRAEMGAVLPQSRIRVWNSAGPTGYVDDPDANLRRIAEIMREHYIRALEPDVILITSPFEGLGDDAVQSVKKYAPDIPVASIFYDLTPLILPDEHFQTSAVHRFWYRDRIADLRRCDLLLAISESARQEVLGELDFPPDAVVNIFGGHSPDFHRKGYSDAQKQAVGARFGMDRPFILYTGGVELNKNLKALVEALSYLPEPLRKAYRFACVGKRKAGEAEQILGYALDPEVREMISVLDYVSQEDLVDLYNSCALFVFPSLREGFGLPALEAMACGAPTLVSNRTSLPEIVANADALFDPESPQSIGAKMAQVLGDGAVRARLAATGLERSKALTWDACADTALRALERLKPDKPFDERRRATVMTTGIFGRKPPSILVQKLDHHGDFFLGLPAMAKLRARYPDARIDILIGAWNRDAAEASGLFDTIHILDYFKAKSSDRPSLSEDQLDIFRSMPFYDYAIDLRRQPDTRFLLLHVKAGAYFGYKTGDGRIDPLLTSALDAHSEPSGARDYFESTHTSEQILRLVDTLPFDVNDYLHLPAMCERLPQRPGAIAIFPRVGLDARQWDSGRFGQLIAALVKSPDVTEINIYAGKPAELDIIPIPDHPKIHLQCGLRFADLGTSLSGNEICVGNNSFGVHLASYVGCKTIGIYSGHELPQQWGPGFNDAKAVMIDVACAPCHLPSREACNFGMRCLEDISVKTVLDLVKAELRGVDDVTYRSDVVAANPASAVRPLLNDINTARAHGRIAPLQHRQRIAVAAAIEMNFPERDREGSVLFVDMSNFRLDVERPAAKTQKDWSAALALVEGLRRNVPSHFSVTMIAASQHDHEYVAFPSATFEDICAPTTGRKAVRPIAGDVYLGIDSYLFRNSAQWDLLYDWRHLGVTTSFLLPTLDLDVWNYGAGESEHAALVDGFLRRVTHLDLLVTADERHARLDQWALDVMPPRERLLRVGHAWGAAAEQRRGGAHPTAPVGTWDDLRVRQLAQLLTGGREAEQSPARPARKPATAL